MAERLPQPMAIDAAVSNGPANRTLIVKRPETASGYQNCRGGQRTRRCRRQSKKAGVPVRPPCRRLVDVKQILLMRCLVTIWICCSISPPLQIPVHETGFAAGAIGFCDGRPFDSLVYACEIAP